MARNTIESYIGRRVMYVLAKYGVSSGNPLRGSEYECAGTITGVVDSRVVYVHWDNGMTNDYSLDTLEMLSETTPKNINLMFKYKKRKRV